MAPLPAALNANNSQFMLIERGRNAYSDAPARLGHINRQWWRFCLRPSIIHLFGSASPLSDSISPRAFAYWSSRCARWTRTHSQRGRGRSRGLSPLDRVALVAPRAYLFWQAFANPDAEKRVVRLSLVP